MTFYLIGINYKTVSNEVRELAYRKRQCIEMFCRQELSGQAAVLFTCNRIEIYGFAKDVRVNMEVLKKVKDVFPEIFSGAYFKLSGHETFQHALRLACGLESQILGERQIVGQLRSWIAKDGFPQELRHKWGLILAWASELRTSLGIDKVKKDIVDFTLEDLQGRLGTLENKKILVVGTGKIAELVSQKELNGASIFFAARKRHAKARKLAYDVGSELISFDDFPRLMREIDAVISATSSPHYIIKWKQLVRWTEKRERTLYIYDLATPRNVSPDVKDIPLVKLYNVDNLVPLLNVYHNRLGPKIDRMSLLIEKIVWMVSDETVAQGRNKTELIGV
jgi:glutamyl-tRNA reductase